MSDNEKPTPSEEEKIKSEENNDKIEQKEVKEENIQKEDEEKNEEKETKNEEIKEEIKVEKNIEQQEETNKEKNVDEKEDKKDEKEGETKEEKNDEAKKENEEEDEKKILSNAINELKSETLKAKSLYLYNINEEMKSQYLDTYKSQKNEIEKKELDNFLNYLNKIRDVVNTSSKENILKLIETENKEKYSINVDDKDDKQEFTHIKDFWYKSLINAKFFEFSEKDKKIIEHIKDMNFIPLEPFPSFKVEFIFEDNDYFGENQNIISKKYIFEENDKDLIKQSEGCEIKWKSEEKNPTIKTIIKKKKKIKEYTTKSVESFFNIFETKESDLNKELVEARFFRDDFFENMLEYYLGIMEIHEEEVDDADEK